VNSSFITVQSKFFGSFEADLQTIMQFENGIPGLESVQEYALITIEEYKPIVWMISTDGVYHFPLVHYKNIDNNDLDQESLQGYKPQLDRFLTKHPESVAYVILKLDQRVTTISLRSPIIIDPKKQAGKQLILDKSGNVFSEGK
jgi:flagellar assembly factor FliW